MILTKGIEIRALEAEFLRLGGAIDRTTPGHVQFKYPGLPTVGVHCNRVRARVRPSPRSPVSRWLSFSGQDVRL